MDKKYIIGFLLGIGVSIGIFFLLSDNSRLEQRSEISDTQTSKHLNGASIKIKIVSILVDNQEKALKFYTEKIGFIKKEDVPVGEYKWLTVVSPDAPDGMELLLEPNAHKAAKDFQKAIFSDNIPATTFFVDDIQKEYERLKELGVEFTTEPTKMGTVTIAVFNDTCGNLIQLTAE